MGAPPPLGEVEPADERWALLNRAGITREASFGEWIRLFGQPARTLVPKPEFLAEVATVHVRLIIDMDELRLLIGQLRKA